MSTTATVSISRKQEPITLTASATAKVAELLAAEDDADRLALRVAVRAGGCSGFSYDMYFDTEVTDEDVVRTFDQVRVAIDKKSVDLLSGSTLDYTDGLQGAGFHITNPNATSTCGCGNSFS